MEQTAHLTKLNPPSYAQFLERHRLYDHVDQALKNRVLWISGPAGAGKTTLISSYLENKELPPLWYQVDKTDADLASFFYHLGLMVQLRQPEQPPLPILTPEYLHGIPVFARNFSAEFFGRFTQENVLVFDNFQDAGAENPLEVILPEVLSQVPEHMCVVILSRNLPPDNLEPMLSSGELQTLNWQHLQFSESEIEGLVELKGASPAFSKTEIADIHQSTQGWAASLVLLLQQPFDMASHLAGKGGSKESLFEFYANELFQRADDEVKNFLLKTAVLHEISVDVAEKITGSGQSKGILEDMAQRNYFTIRRAGTTSDFQYHPLFRDFLLNQYLREHGEKALAEVRSQAAAILLAQGEITSAADLFCQAGNWDELLSLILEHAQSVIEKGHFSTLRGWINSLPEKMQSTNQWLNYWQGVIEITINPISAISKFRTAYTLSQAEGDVLAQVLSWCGAINAYAYSWGEVITLDGWIDDLESIQALAGQIADPNLQEQVDYAAYLALMYRQPQHAKMKEYEEKAWNIVLHSNNPQTRVQAASQLLFYLTWWSGDFDKAEVLVQTMQPFMEHPSAPPLVKLTWHSMLSSYYGSVFKAEECDNNIRMGLALSEKTGIYIWMPWLYLKGCFLYLQKGDPEKSSYYLEHLYNAMRPEDLINQAIYYHFRAWYNLHQENIEGVKENIQIARKLSKEAGNTIVDIFINAGYAKCLFETGEIELAMKTLHEIRQRAMDIDAKTMTFLSYVPEADYLLQHGDKEAAVDILRKLFNITKTYSALWWRDQEFSRFCGVALENDINSDYVKEIINRHQLPPPPDFETDQWPYPIKIYTLGEFKLLIDGEPLVLTGKVQKKPLELLKLIVSLGGRNVVVEKITDELWSGVNADAAYESLRTTVKRLRTLLAHKEAVVFSDGKLSLDPHYCWVDSMAFESVAVHKQADPQLVLNLYKGHFLSTEGECAAYIAPRERMRREFSDVVMRQGALYEADEDWDSAIGLYRKGLNTDPLCEPFYQGLMKGYAHAGNTAEVSKVYQQCKTLLKSTLAVSPSEETTKIFKRLRGKV